MAIPLMRHAGYQIGFNQIFSHSVSLWTIALISKDLVHFYSLDSIVRRANEEA